MKFVLFLCLLLINNTLLFSQKSYIEITNVFNKKPKNTNAYGYRYNESEYIDNQITRSININGLNNMDINTYHYAQKADTCIKICKWYIVENKYEVPPYDHPTTSIQKGNKVSHEIGFRTKDSLINIFTTKPYHYSIKKNNFYEYSEIEVIIKSPNYKNYLDTSLFEVTKYFYKNEKLVKKEYSKNDTSYVYTTVYFNHNSKGLPTQNIEINRGDTNWIETFYRDITDSISYSVFRWKDFTDSTIIHSDTTLYSYNSNDTATITYQYINSKKYKYLKESYDKNGNLISENYDSYNRLYRYDKKNRLIYYKQSGPESYEKSNYYTYKKRRKTKIQP